MNLNKTVLITGSSRGIGEAIAEAFLKDGYNIIINAKKSEEELKTLEKRLKNHSESVLAVMADVSVYEEATKLYKSACEKFGSVDVLINNAGISHFGLFSDTTQSDWQNIINTNLISCMNMSHLVVPDMISRKSGRIINISSVWGISGASCEVLYSTTKGAINTFTKALAKELAPSNISVNAIALGVIDTEMNNNLSEEEKHALAEEIPMGRFGKTEEAASLAVYLASEKAQYLTGQIITVDGGFL